MGDDFIVGNINDTFTYANFGNTPDYGQLSQAMGVDPFKISAFAREATSGVGMWETQDVSNGNAVWGTGTIQEITFFDTRYQLTSLTNFTAPTVSAGDLFVFSGSFVINTDDPSTGGTVENFADTFNDGTYTGAYDGQTVTFTIAAIPEPSTALLSLLSIVGLGVYRRR